MDWLQMEKWSPYAVGIGIGILSWISLLLINKPIGCSTAFSRTSGMIERIFRGKDRVNNKEYYKQFAPVIDWEWVLVCGVIFGAWLSAQLSGVFTWEFISPRWSETFGSALLPRLVVAFIGGIIMGIGARWAGGCTSGHGISGTLQLAVSSWIAAICFFIGGIITAMGIYKFFA